MIRKKSIIVAAILASASTNAYADPSALVALAIAKTGTLNPVANAYGTVSGDPSSVTTVPMPREGRITQVFVRAGQVVNQGDPIVTIVSSPASEAQYRQVQSTADFARKDLDHTRALFAEQLATRSQLAAAEKAYSDATAQLTQQHRMGADQGSQILRAPSAGIVASLGVSMGDTEQLNASIATIAAHNRLVVNLGLESDDARTVPVGAGVWLQSPHNTTPGFAGKVLSVGAMIDPQTRLVNCTVQIPDDVAPRLTLGSTYTAHIELSAKRGILVPRGALLEDANGLYVFVVSKGVAHRRAIAVSLETDKSALVSQGLSNGEAVASDGNVGLDDGSAERTR